MSYAIVVKNESLEFTFINTNFTARRLLHYLVENDIILNSIDPPNAEAQRYLILKNNKVKVY